MVHYLMKLQIKIITQPLFSNFTFTIWLMRPSGDILGVFDDDKCSFNSRSNTSSRFLFKTVGVLKPFMGLVAEFLSTVEGVMLSSVPEI